MKQHHSQCVKNLLLGTVRLTNLMTRLSAPARRHLARAAMAVGVLLCRRHSGERGRDGTVFPDCQYDGR